MKITTAALRVAVFLAAGLALGAALPHQASAEKDKQDQTPSGTIPADPGEPGDGATPAVPGGGHAYGRGRNGGRERDLIEDRHDRREDVRDRREDRADRRPHRDNGHHRGGGNSGRGIGNRPGGAGREGRGRR